MLLFTHVIVSPLVPTLNIFMAILVENFLNTLFLHSNVVFDHDV